MQAWIETASFLAHGYCLLWEPWLVRLYAGADLLIFTAYALIPIALLRFLRQRPDLRYRGLVALFAAFILLCGISHLVSVLTLWYPAYPLHAGVKIVTGLVSMVTAIVLFTLIPRLVRIPSPTQLEAAHARLQQEITAHERTLERLRAVQRDLESAVESRTAELAGANARLSVITQETLHRARNLLTMVAALAQQTAREADSVDGFVQTFSGRLGALADATAAVTGDSTDTSADLGAMVRGQLEPVLSAFPDRITVEGPCIRVRAEAAAQLALVVHELATNSVKYGALSGAGGTVALRWTLPENGAAGPFSLTWDERRDAPAAAETGRTSGGFGTMLLTRAVPGALKGVAELTRRTDGLRYVLEVSLDRLRPAPAAPEEGDRIEGGLTA